MSMLGWFKNIGTGSSQTINSVKKAYQDKINRVLGTRPTASNTGSSHGYNVPRYYWPTWTLYEVSYNSDVLTTIQRTLKQEVFRNKFEIVKERDTDPDYLSYEGYEPKEKDRQKLIKQFKNINSNKQTLKQVLEEIEDDLNIIDDAYMSFLYDYQFDSDGYIDFEKSEVLETIRSEPIFMRIVMGYKGIPGTDSGGNYVMSCPNHRNNEWKNITECPKCGMKLYQAHFYFQAEQEREYYFNWEVVHASRYRPSKSYGYSPVITTYQKTFTLFAQDSYVKEVYEGKRPPKGGLFFNTSNTDSLEKNWEKAVDMSQENPNLPFIMAVTNTGDKQPRKFVEFIDFMKNLDELQYTQQREEFWRSIGSVFGVMPIFHGDMSQGGGLNNEGLEITVTNRAMEVNQTNYNEVFFPAIIKAYKAHGWVLRLLPNEEQDEMAELERQGKMLDNAEKAVKLGLKVEYDSKQGNIIIESGEITAPSGGFEDSGFSGNIPFSASNNDQPTEEQTSPDENSTSPQPEPPDVKKNITHMTNNNNYFPVLKAKPKFSKFQERIEKEVDQYIKRLKRTPTKQELKKLINEVRQKLHLSLREDVSKYFKDIYDQGVQAVERDLGVNFVFGAKDENVLEALKNQKVLSDAFVGVADSVADKLHNVLEQSISDPTTLTIDNLTDKIKDISNIADFRAENIARTEAGKVFSAARRVSYLKEDRANEFRYKWIGPNDNRTTKTSKRIKQRVGKGVDWDNLVRIVQEEAAKDFPEWKVDPDALMSHYQSRHIWVRTQD